jgi:mono/diheme cytochrome c family protein
MKLSVAILGLGLLAAPAAFADPAPAVSDGEAVFAARCNFCHGTGQGGAPLMDKLAALEPAAVVEKLTTGTMSAMAAGISDENKRDIAVYLTKKPLAAAGDLPAVTP